MRQGRIWYVWQCRRCSQTVWHAVPSVVTVLASRHQAAVHHRGRSVPEGTWTRWTVWRGRPWGCPARSQAPLTLVRGARIARKEGKS